MFSKLFIRMVKILFDLILLVAGYLTMLLGIVMCTFLLFNIPLTKEVIHPVMLYTLTISICNLLLLYLLDGPVTILNKKCSNFLNDLDRVLTLGHIRAAKRKLEEYNSSKKIKKGE